MSKLWEMTGNAGMLQSMGWQKVRHDWSDFLAHTQAFMTRTEHSFWLCSCYFTGKYLKCPEMKLKRRLVGKGSPSHHRHPSGSLSLPAPLPPALPRRTGREVTRTLSEDPTGKFSCSAHSGPAAGASSVLPERFPSLDHESVHLGTVKRKYWLAVRQGWRKWTKYQHGTSSTAGAAMSVEQNVAQEESGVRKCHSHLQNPRGWTLTPPLSTPKAWRF